MKTIKELQSQLNELIITCDYSPREALHWAKYIAKAHAIYTLKQKSIILN